MVFLFNLTLTLSILLLFNVIILRFGRLLNKVLFSKYYVKTAILEIDGKEFPVVEGSETNKPLILRNYEI
jgi:hypothetical protein